MFDLRAMFDNMHKCVDGTVLGHDLSGIFSVSCELFMLYIVIVNTFMCLKIYIDILLALSPENKQCRQLQMLCKFNIHIIFVYT